MPEKRTITLIGLHQEHEDLKRGLRTVQRSLAFYQAHSARLEREKHELRQIIKGRSAKAKRSYEERKASFKRVEEIIRKIVLDKPGLTCNEIGDIIENTRGFRPTIRNRVRSLRKQGKVITRPGNDNLLHVFPNLSKVKP